MDASKPAGSHWPKHAKLWALLGPPLRPCGDDVAAITAAISPHLAPSASPRVLLLGATPELATLPWPATTELVAVDRSRAILDHVLPTTGVPARTERVEGEWTTLPDRGRFDVVLGDGALTCLAFPDDYRALAAELRRVAAPGATIAVRVFTAPDRGESLDDVAADLARGAIASLHTLKLRIGMAIQGADRTVRVTDMLAAFEDMVPDWPATAAARGWAPALVETFDAYRGSPARYSFPTAAEVRDALAGELDWLGADYPDYELGDRCPTVRLRPR